MVKKLLSKVTTISQPKQSQVQVLRRWEENIKSGVKKLIQKDTPKTETKIIKKTFRNHTFVFSVVYKTRNTFAHDHKDMFKHGDSKTPTS